MLGTAYPSPKYLPPNNDCHPLLTQALPFLQDADITFGNLEGCFLDQGPTTKNCKDTLKCYAFRMPSKYANCLKEAGFDVLSLANNHSGDFGMKGRENTIHLLDSLGIEHGGLEIKPTAEWEQDSIKYAFVAFAPIRATLDMLDLKNAAAIVKDLKSRNDLVIVSFHGGAEGKDFEHITRESEEFYGEDRGNVYEFAHIMVDAGADLIFGHGPHVTRAIEVYKNRFIAYSLGNFATYARFNLSGPNGLAPMVKIYTNTQGEFLYGQIFSFRQKGEGGPKIDPHKLVLKKIKQLNAEDFPENKLQILDNGLFMLK
ncbi:MAG: capsule biosynthesis protein CapA [Bacteroidetes bacterium 4572_77]|nr:MAG: capsule biosynthesis protein CapA [Bacteroidetes bacterium 4572_77]